MSWVKADKNEISKYAYAIAKQIHTSSTVFKHEVHHIYIYIYIYIFKGLTVAAVDALLNINTTDLIKATLFFSVLMVQRECQCLELIYSQRTHDVTITPLLHQNDVASFWRNNDVIFTSRVRNNVIITSKRRCNVILTYWWHHHFVMYPLGYSLDCASVTLMTTKSSID